MCKRLDGVPAPRDTIQAPTGRGRYTVTLSPSPGNPQVFAPNGKAQLLVHVTAERMHRHATRAGARFVQPGFVAAGSHRQTKFADKLHVIRFVKLYARLCDKLSLGGQIKDSPDYENSDARLQASELGSLHPYRALTAPVYRACEHFAILGPNGFIPL